MISFSCPVCLTGLQAEEAQIGQKVRCPSCHTAIPVPKASTHAEGAVPRAPIEGGGRRYGFNCPYCSSRLEASESMAAQEGQCPTCGSNIVIPILDRQGRLVDPTTRKIIRPDPIPVHAYAAAGDRAPTIRHINGEKQVIICRRCGTASPITANNCRSCGMPFTIEGTHGSQAGVNNGFCVASLVLGVIGVPTAYFLLPSLLAVIFGCVGYAQVSRPGAEMGGKAMAISGIVCGIVGLGLFLGFIIH